MEFFVSLFIFTVIAVFIYRARWQFERQASQSAMIEELVRALEHCRDFDTSAKFGYDYGQRVRGHKPDPDQRWLTPKERAEWSLAKYRAWKKENEE